MIVHSGDWCLFTLLCRLKVFLQVKLGLLLYERIKFYIRYDLRPNSRLFLFYGKFASDENEMQIYG